MNSSQTLLGYVYAVSGSTVNVYLLKTVQSGITIINGSTYKIGQVGSFVRIPLGYQDLFGVVSEIGVNAVPESIKESLQTSANWIKIQLVGESIGSLFERGISQYPNVNDEVHIVTEQDLFRIYGKSSNSHVSIGRLTSAEAVEVKIDINKLISRHSAILGSTGSGKSTTITSLLRSIIGENSDNISYPNARILLLDIHGEYSEALHDIASIFQINAEKNETELSIPFWTIDTLDLINFLTGGIPEDKLFYIYDKIIELKLNSIKLRKYPGVTEESLTVDTPVPFSLKRLWLELIDLELMTLEGPDRTQPALIKKGDANLLLPPHYKPYGLGSKGPFMNQNAPGIKRQLNNIRSRLIDKRYDFLLHPGDWEPELDGTIKRDLSDLLKNWLGNEKPITILDLSGIPSQVLVRLIGSILRVVYEALFWSRDKSEGGIERPLLIVMEEAHRYISNDIKGFGEKSSAAKEMVQRIVKEGRKYGIGAMIVSQRPYEIDDTILSQCGTFIALRLSNPSDRESVKGTLPDQLITLMDMLPILRTGEAIITGEAAQIPMRCKVTYPGDKHSPNSKDPDVSKNWSHPRFLEDYERVALSWRAQSPRAKFIDSIKREPIDDQELELDE